MTINTVGIQPVLITIGVRACEADVVAAPDKAESIGVTKQAEDSSDEEDRDDIEVHVAGVSGR